LRNSLKSFQMFLSLNRTKPLINKQLNQKKMKVPTASSARPNSGSSRRSNVNVKAV